MKLGDLKISDRENITWACFEGDSIFMTGGTGFFGSAMLYSLLKVNTHNKININVTLLTRDILSFKTKHPTLFESEFIDCIQGNVVDFEFPDKKFSKIFHLATTTANETFNGESQLKKYKTLVNGTERVMQFAAKCGAKKVLFTSSGVVYGGLINAEVKETHEGAPVTIDPTSALGHGKRSAEFIVAYYANKYDIDYVIARCFSFVGPALPLDIHYAIGNFIYDVKENRCITIKGDGSPIRSYLDINDLIIWLLVLMERNCKHKIYNVGSDQLISILDLANKIKLLLAPSIKIDVLSASEKSKDNFNRNIYVPNISRARDELGLDVWTNLDESIKKMT